MVHPSQIIIDFESADVMAGAISYEKAQKLQELAQYRKEYEAKRERARWLAGKRRGAWGLTTGADLKRSAELDRMREAIKYKESQLEQML